MKCPLAIFITIALICLGLWSLSGLLPGSTAPGDLPSFRAVAIQSGGRIKPLGTEAEGLMRILSGRSRPPESVAPSAVAWYAKLLFTPAAAADDAVFRVDSPAVIDDLGLDAKGKYFPFSKFVAKRDQVMAHVKSALATSQTARTSFERAILQLVDKLDLYTAVANALNDESGVRFDECVAGYRALVPTVLKLDKDRSTWSADETKSFDLLRTLYALMVQSDRSSQWAVIPVSEAADADSEVPRWLNPYRSLMDGIRVEAAQPPAVCVRLAEMQTAWTAYEKGDRQDVAHLEKLEAAAAEFNALVTVPDPSASWVTRSRIEGRYNRWRPFNWCRGLYLVVFLFSCFAWVGRARLWNRAAFQLLVLAFVLHTGALLMRILITGRPPVTSLYSSTLFVAWICVLAGLVLERITRQGYALTCASVIGLLALLKGYEMTAETQDLMPVLMAVLNSNYWLSTHVICITIGYASCFFASIVGHIYVVRVLFGTTPDTSGAAALDRMAYGIVCFGLLFSLVGTILGGIWADQSWGRFWGWDPKENGALLICLWLIIVLHARMGGYIKRRGTMVMAIAAGMITAVSWFGVNLLGTGLHSYGFTERGMLSFFGFLAIELAVIGVGLWMPAERWRRWDGVTSTS